jgi:hypothetical protein
MYFSTATETASSRALRVSAELLGWIVSPLALPVLGAGVAAHALGATGEMTAWIAAATLVGTGLLPLLYIGWLLRRGEVETLDIRDRRHRARPIVFSIGCMSAQAALMSALLPDALGLVADIAWASAFNVGLLLAITLVWKVSFHLSALACTTGVLAGLMAFAPLERPVSTTLLAVLLLLIPTLAWARVHVGAHTWWQTFAGTVFGLVLAPLEVLLFVALRA